MAEQRKRFWRDAATLVIAGKTHQGRTTQGRTTQGSNQGDFRVLMLERNKESKFFPGAFVFPGGTVSDVDFSSEWSPLFNKVVAMTMEDVAKQLYVPGLRPPLMTHPMTQSQEGISNQQGQILLDPCIALRICAIRETFEESGLLLATKQSHNRKDLTGSSSVVTGDQVGERTFESWRERVLEDPWNFLAMCQDLHVVPDVWSLSEWSNWLTPVMKQVEGPSLKPHRFDTFFFACCVDHIPKAVQDEREITSTRWVRPRDIAGSGGRPIPDVFQHVQGPQRYEIFRLANFVRLEEMFSYIREREPLGIEQWFPVVLGCRDGVACVLPGDGLYPKNPDRNGTRTMEYRDMTVEALRKETSQLHRNERTVGRWKSFCNMKLNCGQIGHMPHELSQL